MSASKRDFKDFSKFPGQINEGTGIYEFPKLMQEDELKHVRQWQTFVRLVKDQDNKPSSIDWNLLDENQIPIHDEYLLGKLLPEGTIAESWVETGVVNGKITRSIPSYFNRVANKGRANQRNQLQQALIAARSLYIKKHDKGGTKNTKGKYSKKENLGTVMYFPMLARSWENGKYVKYPAFLQPKLDGVRCLTYLSRLPEDNEVDDWQNVVLYSRSLKTFPDVDYLKKILYPYLRDLFDTEKNQSIYLDGELYKHGKTLQEISGDSRSSAAHKQRATKSKSKTKSEVKSEVKSEELDAPQPDVENNRNEYHIYDCFYPLELDTKYTDRKDQLAELMNNLAPGDAAYIKQVPTTQVNSEDEAQNEFKRLISLGYEGAILRNSAGKYLADPNKSGTFMRSKDLIKLKKRETAEFEVVDFTEGSKGKDKGAIIWVCKTPDTNKLFNITPKNITYEERKELFNECKKSFNKKYKGRMITIEYEDLSKDRVPLRAKALTFRDYE